MKFSWKIFFVSFLVIVVSFGAGGFVLINTVFSDMLQSRIEDAQEKNASITNTLLLYISNNPVASDDADYLCNTAVKYAEQVAEKAKINANIGSIYSLSYFDDIESFVYTMAENSRGSRVVEDDGKYVLQTVSSVGITDQVYYVETIEDLTDVYKSRDSYYSIYRIVLLGVAVFASVVLLVFSKLITRTLEKLTAATKRIADGKFDMRVEPWSGITSSSETQDLSHSFNQMADRVEEHIDRLNEEKERRDIFIADFTHELKTPLTSVIGYADMLRSYDLTPEQRRECAQQIYSEGTRLEALSLNLLNILVLKNTDISRVRISAGTLADETEKTVRFRLKKCKVTLKLEVEDTEIICEPSLIETMLINLIDNACKASKPGSEVVLSGCPVGSDYRFCVSDHGCGIAPEELAKITQPFYMVDKSRSRSMGGAGLGLALCAEIARLHGGLLDITSEPRQGTSVSFLIAPPSADSELSTKHKEGEADGQ